MGMDILYLVSKSRSFTLRFCQLRCPWRSTCSCPFHLHQRETCDGGCGLALSARPLGGAPCACASAAREQFASPPDLPRMTQRGSAHDSTRLLFMTERGCPAWRGGKAMHPPQKKQQGRATRVVSMSPGGSQLTSLPLGVEGPRTAATCKHTFSAFWL